jgi:hypothetical protein
MRNDTETKKLSRKMHAPTSFFCSEEGSLFPVFFFGLQVCRKSRRRQLTIDAITVLAAKWLGRHGFGAKQVAPVETNPCDPCAKQGGARSGSGKEPRRMMPYFPCASCFAKDYVLGKVKMRERERARARARAG